MGSRQYTGPLVPRIRSADGFSHVSGEAQNKVYHEGRKMAAHVLDEMEQFGTNWAARQYETPDGTVIRTHASQAPGMPPMVYVEAVVQPPSPSELTFDEPTPDVPEPENEVEIQHVPPLFVLRFSESGDTEFVVLEPNPDVPLGSVRDEVGGWRLADKPWYIKEGRHGDRCTTDETDDPRFVVTGTERRDDGDVTVFGYGGDPVGVLPEDGTKLYVNGMLVNADGFVPDANGTNRTGTRGLKGSLTSSGNQRLVVGNPSNGKITYTVAREVESGRRKTEESSSYVDISDPPWSCSYAPNSNTASYDDDGKNIKITWTASDGGCTIHDYTRDMESIGSQYETRGLINWGFEPDTEYEHIETTRHHEERSFTASRDFGSSYSGQSQRLSHFLGGYSAQITYSIHRFSTATPWTSYRSIRKTDGLLSFAGKSWELTGYFFEESKEGKTPGGTGDHDLQNTKIFSFAGEYEFGYGCSADWNCPIDWSGGHMDTTETRNPGREYKVRFIEPRLKAYMLAEYITDYTDKDQYGTAQIFILDEIVLEVPYWDYQGGMSYTVTPDGCGVVRIYLDGGVEKWFGAFDGRVDEITALFPTPSDQGFVSLLGALRGLANTPEHGFPTMASQTIPT